jgi:hypothetical protein
MYITCQLPHMAATYRLPRINNCGLQGLIHTTIHITCHWPRPRCTALQQYPPTCTAHKEGKQDKRHI